MRNEWQGVLDEIRRNTSDMVFETYFANLKLISNKDGCLLISAPNVFIKAQLEGHKRSILVDALDAVGVKYEDLVIEMSKVGSNRKVERRMAIEVPETKTSAQNVAQISNAHNVSAPDTDGLNPRYRFDNYIVGENNDLAVSAAHAIVDKPGQRYNPYFIYGGPGLGKTHLIQAIGNELKARDPNLKVLYVTIEQFYHDFVEAMRKKLDGFSDKYRKVDVLIIDDFQFIVGKEKSQDEFFHTFNELHQKNKQIIVSSDRLPNQIATVDERLSSRLMMGVPIDIQLPNFEVRCAILKSKAELLGVELEDSVVEFLAENIKSNIRELEGKLNQLLALSEVRGVNPCDLISDGYMDEAVHSRKRNMTAKQIIDKVAKYYDLSSKDLLGASRVKNIKSARQVAMYLISEELDYSTVKIGDEFNKDHTTVMHSIKKIKQDLKIDFALREQMSDLRGKIYAN